MLVLFVDETMKVAYTFMCLGRKFRISNYSTDTKAGQNSKSIKTTVKIALKNKRAICLSSEISYAK